MTPRLWTAEQLAEYLQVGVETVWRYTREGKLPAVKLGNHYRYRVDEAIEALMHSGQRHGGAAAPNQQQPMTYKEFSQLPEQPGLQLIDGLLVKEPSPRYGHQAIIGRLFLEMAPYVNERGLGRVILAPFDVVLAAEQVLQPDIMFVAEERTNLIQENGLFGAPDLVVEVLSPSSRRHDTGRKRELYFEHGCSEMWTIDPDELTLILSVRGECGWRDTLSTRDDTFVSPTLEGFRLDIVTLGHL